MGQPVDRGALFGVQMELVGICPKCGALVPINGLLSQVTCTSCGLTIEVTGEDWETILNPILERARDAEPGFREDFPLDLPEWPIQVTWTFLGQGPFGFEAADLRSPPSEYEELFSWLVGLLGEDSAQFSSADAGLVAVKTEIRDMEEQVLCPHCGARLSVEGAGRTVTCPQCGKDSALPDSLWYRLHPVVRVKPWTIVFQ